MGDGAGLTVAKRAMADGRVEVDERDDDELELAVVVDATDARLVTDSVGVTG